MTHEELKRMVSDAGHEDALVFENPSYDGAFVGVSHDGRAIYDYDMMVVSLMEEDGMTEEEAVEFIDYNTLRALPYFGEKAPIVMFKIDA